MRLRSPQPLHSKYPFLRSTSRSRWRPSSLPQKPASPSSAPRARKSSWMTSQSVMSPALSFSWKDGTTSASPNQVSPMSSDRSNYPPEIPSLSAPISNRHASMRRSPQFLQHLLPFRIIRIELQYPLHNSPCILHLSFRRQCLRQVHSDGARPRHSCKRVSQQELRFFQLSGLRRQYPQI